MAATASRPAGTSAGAPDDPATCAARAVARLARLIEIDLGDTDLSLPQYRLLAFLAEGDWAASALADKLRVSRPSVTSLVDGLVARGFVTREHATDDRRRVLHVITTEGLEALAAADGVLAERIDEVVSVLDPDDAARAVDGMAVVLEALDTRRAEKMGRGSEES